MNDANGTATYEANKIYESFSADYTAISHYAMRPDGQWFTRNRFRDPRYGYRNSAWRAVGFIPDNLRSPYAARKARLPK